jgi:hypothetical protein
MELFLAGSAKLVGEEKAISVIEARDWVAPDTPCYCALMQQARIKNENYGWNIPRLSIVINFPLEDRSRGSGDANAAPWDQESCSAKLYHPA